MYFFSINGTQLLANTSTMDLGLSDRASPGLGSLRLSRLRLSSLRLGSPRLGSQGLDEGLPGVAIRVALCINGITLIWSQCDLLVEQIKLQNSPATRFKIGLETR